MNITLDIFALIGAIGSLAWTVAIFFDINHHKILEARVDGAREQRLADLEHQMQNVSKRTEDTAADHNDAELALTEQRKDIERLNEKVDALTAAVQKLVGKVEDLTAIVQQGMCK